MNRLVPAPGNESEPLVGRAFADTLRRLDPSSDPLVLRAAERACLAVSLGDAAVDLQQMELPDASHAALRASAFVSQPAPDVASDPAKPLVLEQGLLYLRRYREYERRLAQGLRRLATQPPVATDLRALAPVFAALFPQASAGDAQATAAALALRRALLLVTGGPGTGKTTTIARVLLLLLAQARSRDAPMPRIVLAAPTGRAAERMAESLRQARAAMRAAAIDADLCDRLPVEARTLHRLLGAVPDSPRFRHHADNPLPFDVVVVDEASMVDLPLMCKLVEAIASGTRLILLGDPDQLPSIEAGDVLAAIADAAGVATALSPDDADALAPLFGLPRPVQATADLFAHVARPAPLAGHRVHLQRGYRQSESLELAPLADAVRAGDSDRLIALLRERSLAGVHFHETNADPLRAASTRDALLAPWRALADLDDPAAALAAAGRVRLLTALREGAVGVHQLNAGIEEALAGALREPYFHGRLLLVTENSYRHGLFNGDVGVCMRDPAGGTVAWFAGADRQPRGFHPAALPAHASAFAVTVHKAQGSEFDAVWLVLPGQDARILSRAVLYTAITRARGELHLCAHADVLRATLDRNVSRVSGLRQRLG